ncbi:hypothetical protein K488DRAFT_83569 [Vararia minispora EC-137]|uniref:Uncharacterized protein n=1 Tax=Vararia minispora EC-137 TaxID=1314806 RepID=A0ACB8QUE2_9AGAM|nr:hypothetical protein K488DRAFT_83569 [Vararia minispora EC-137]
MANENVPSSSHVTLSPALTLANTPALAAPGSFSRESPDRPRGDGDSAHAPETQPRAQDTRDLASIRKKPSARSRAKAKDKGKNKATGDQAEMPPPEVDPAVPPQTDADRPFEDAYSLEDRLIRASDHSTRQAIALQAARQLAAAGARSPAPSPRRIESPRPIDVSDEDDEDVDDPADRSHSSSPDLFMTPAPVPRRTPAFPVPRSAGRRVTLAPPPAPDAPDRPASPAGVVYDLPSARTSSFSDELPISPFYDNNFVDHRYIPMSAFSEEALRLMAENPSKYVKSDRCVGESSKKQFVQFDGLDMPREESLTPVLWACAAQRWIAWLETPTASGMQKLHTELMELMRLHFRLVKAQPGFGEERFARDTWPSLLKHDISYRRRFFFVPFTFTEQDWRFRLQEQITSDMAEVNAAIRALSAQPRFVEPGRFLDPANAPRAPNSNRFQPYSRDRSFRATGSRSSDADRADRASKKRCFGCGRRAHLLANCSEKQTVDGKGKLVAFKDGVVLLPLDAKSGTRFCCAFNANSRCSPDKHGNDVKHACCLCGSFGHAAFDWVCNASERA